MRKGAGSEACYIEIARWNFDTDEWQRYAFEKLFGGEIPGFPDDNDVTACQRVADQINAAAPRYLRHTGLIHSFKNFEAPLTYRCPYCGLVFARTECQRAFRVPEGAAGLPEERIPTAICPNRKCEGEIDLPQEVSEADERGH